jgi:hypothetical protein
MTLQKDRRIKKKAWKAPQVRCLNAGDAENNLPSTNPDACSPGPCTS